MITLDAPNPERPRGSPPFSALQPLSIFAGHWIGRPGHWLLLGFPEWQENDPISLLQRLTKSYAAPTASVSSQNVLTLDQGLLYGLAPYESGIRFNWPQMEAGKTPNNAPSLYAAFTREVAVLDAQGQVVAEYGQRPEFKRQVEALSKLWLTLQAARQPGPPPFSCSAFKPDWSFSDYEGAFKRVKAYIEAGDCYQINLAQRFQASFEGSALAAFIQLMGKIPAPYATYMETCDATFLSCSPEHFITINGPHLRTDPIKGTRPRHADPKQDAEQSKALLASAKDQAENLMIVDLLRNDLGRMADTGSVRVPDLFRLESFQNVHHLVSTIEARLRPDVHPLRALLSCLPGGSITGAPKKRAIEIISELECAPREGYCGSQFIASPTHWISNITIRTLQLRGDTLTLWGGGGIVADSECRAEYNESLIKINHIAAALGAPTLPLWEP